MSKLANFVKPKKTVFRLSLVGNSLELENNFQICDHAQIVTAIGMMNSAIISFIAGVNIQDHIRETQHVDKRRE